jgi:hypothetical protein
MTDRVELEKCIYCDESLNESDEHILQEGFGSTLSSTTIVCSTCNCLFSKTIDIICLKQYALICNQFGISGKRKKGRSKGIGKNVEVFDSKDKKVILHGNQKIGVKDKPKVNMIKGSNGKPYIFDIVGTDYKAIQSVIKEIKKGLKPGQKIKIEQGKIEREEPGFFRFPLSLTTSYFKGIKKSLLNFLAYCDPDFIRSGAVKKCFNDIYHSSIQIRDNKKTIIDKDDIYPLFAIDKNIIFSKFSPSVKSGIEHLIVVSLNPSDKNIIGVVILFSRIVHAFILSDNYSGKPKSYMYCHDPLSNKTDSTQIKFFEEALIEQSNIVDQSQKNDLKTLIEREFTEFHHIMGEKALSIAVNDIIKNPFDPLPFPSGVVKENFVELEDSFKRFFFKLARFKYGNEVYDNEAVQELVKYAASQSARSFIEKHGEKKFTKEMQIGENLLIMYQQLIDSSIDMFLKETNK